MGEKRDLFCDRCGKLVCKDIDGKRIIGTHGWESVRLRRRFTEEGKYTQFCEACWDEYQNLLFRFIDKKEDTLFKSNEVHKPKKTVEWDIYRLGLGHLPVYDISKNEFVLAWDRGKIARIPVKDQRIFIPIGHVFNAQQSDLIKKKLITAAKKFPGSKRYMYTYYTSDLKGVPDYFETEGRPAKMEGFAVVITKKNKGKR